jgi:hypothetical protein
MLKAYPTKELQIGLDGGEALFSIEGAIIRRPASGNWRGFACLPYGMLLSFLKVKPANDPVRLELIDGRLRVGTSSFKAQWVETSPWIPAPHN